MDFPNRKQNRLKNYDYSEIGCYFVTICTEKRQHLFNIQNMPIGNDLCVVPQNQIIHKWIRETATKYQLNIDNYAIMPDHIHLLITISERHTGRSLQKAIQFFKTMSTNEYIRFVKTGVLPPFSQKLWQKSYYDHIIRNQQDYEETWEYIENNPIQWYIKHK